MIRVLCDSGTVDVAQRIAELLDAEFVAEQVVLLPQDAAWTDDARWDDVLIVVFKSRVLSSSAQAYVEAFRNAHALTTPGSPAPRPGGFIIPVAVDPRISEPPPPISGLKSLAYDGTPNSVDRLTHSVGVFLGMALRPGEFNIFISYRAADGSEIARDLYDRLTAEGFHPWLDEAQENLPAGAEVQETIRENLASAALVLLVDTSSAPSSKWIKLEIDVALGDLIPVLPVVVGPDDISRFITLSSLRRRAPVKAGGVDRQPLNDGDWSVVLREIKELLFQAYRRRLRTVFHAERNFRDHGFDWGTIDPRKRMFRSQKSQQLLPNLVVLSHCSIHDVSYIPALRAYSEFIEHFPNPSELNHTLCVYDRDDVLAEAEIDTIRESLSSLPFILAHYNELGVLLGSGFTRLR